MHHNELTTSFTSEISKLVTQRAKRWLGSQIRFTITLVESADVFGALIACEIGTGIADLIEKIGDNEDKRSFEDIDKGHDDSDDDLIFMPGAYTVDECEIFPALLMLILIFCHLIINREIKIFLKNSGFRRIVNQTLR